MNPLLYFFVAFRFIECLSYSYYIIHHYIPMCLFFVIIICTNFLSLWQLTVHLFLCLSFLSVCLSFLSIYMSVCFCLFQCCNPFLLSIPLPACICLSISLSAYLSVCLSLCLSISMSIYLYVYLFCLFVFFFI